jgi:hypothetical protein
MRIVLSFDLLNFKKNHTPEAIIPWHFTAQKCLSFWPRRINPAFAVAFAIGRSFRPTKEMSFRPKLLTVLS